MGHLVNPISFRLGKTFYWNFVWSTFLKKNYRFLALQDIQFIKLFDWLLSLNTLYQFGVFFSHFKVYRFHGKLIFFIYFTYDKQQGFGLGPQLKAIKLRKSSKTFLKNSSVLTKKVKIQKFSTNFINLTKSSLYKKILKLCINRIANNLFLNSKFFNFLIFYIKNKLVVNQRLALQKELKKRKNLTVFLKFLFIIKWFIKNISENDLNVFSFILYNLQKKKVIHSSQKALIEEGNTKLKINSVFLKKINAFFFEKRVLFIFEFLLSKSLDYLNKKKGNARYFIFSKLIDSSTYTSVAHSSSFLIARALIDLMKYKKYSVKRALDMLVSNLHIENNVLGYKIAISGRLSRSRRGLYLCKKDGKISLNTVKLPIDYTSTYFKTKFGICGVKVWLNKRFPMEDLIKENKEKALSSFFKHKLRIFDFKTSFQEFSFNKKNAFLKYLLINNSKLKAIPDYSIKYSYSNNLEIVKRSIKRKSFYKKNQASFIL
jgi:hypothetical protein